MDSLEETVSARPWRAAEPPKSILVIRFHAIGDVAITLPSCVSLRKRFPDARIDFLTSEESKFLPSSVDLFDSVIGISTRESQWVRLWSALVTGIRLGVNRYGLVLDLQRNWMSRIIRRLSFPASWSEFDRYSPLPAGERVTQAFIAAGVGSNAASGPLPVRRDLLERGRGLLAAKGWDGRQKLIVLNPAGLWETRNWPLEGYVEFSRKWLDEEPVKFVCLGTERIRGKATLLSGALGASLLNLVGETSLDEAMAVLHYCSLILTEDSGLMHMGWTSGVPTLALFGSSRHDWSRPLGKHTVCLHSGDLPCGACMEPTCRFGDVHCLTRYSAAQVFEASRAIMQTAVAVGA